MKTFLAGLLLSCAAMAPSVRAELLVDFTVAPNGNDAWSGRLAAPNRKQTDGPFATLPKAQAALRQLRQQQPKRRSPFVVLVRGGTYFLSEPLVFTAEDSGTADAPAIFGAYPGEEPVFSGGVLLTGWQATADGRWELTIPKVASGEWNFMQLFVNGQRRYRPRLPKQGYYLIADAVPPSASAKGFDRFRFNAGEVRGDWHNLGDVEVLGFQAWTMARMRIAAVDDAQHVVSFTGDTRGTQWWQSLPKGNRFLIENVRESLSQPGEWYLDRKSGVLTYIPLPGEKLGDAVVIAPRLENLVQIKADIAKDAWVQHMKFRGLTLAHTNWNSPPEGNNFPQAEVNIGGAFTADGARHCVLEDCTITHIGTYAIELGQGCQDNLVEHCALTDLGAGGVKLGRKVRPGETTTVESPALSRGNIVRNNLIAHGGRLLPAAVGVWIGHSPENVVEHNDIFDFYYTGISVGWTWGYAPSLAHHNTVAFNHVWQIGQGVLSDMGGIYTLGISTGSVIRHNIFHDIESFNYGGWGIYFDEGTTGMLAENNIVYRTKTGGFHQHYGKENIVRNNIFAFARQDGQIIRTRVEEHRSFTFEHNIVYWKDAPLLGSNWGGDNYTLNYNLYWRTDGKPVDFAGMTLEQWQKKGQDLHSLIADPLFVDPDKADFQLRNGSPAEKIGFKPIETRGIGLRPTPSQTRAAKQPVPRAFPSP